MNVLHMSLSLIPQARVPLVNPNQSSDIFNLINIHMMSFISEQA